MKLCWDNMDRIYLGLGLDFSRYLGVFVNYDQTGRQFRNSDGRYEIREHCDWCGEPFLTRTINKANYCDSECKHNHFVWNQNKKHIIKQIENKKLYGEYKKPSSISCAEKSKVFKAMWADPVKREDMINIFSNRRGKDNPNWKGGTRHSRFVSYNRHEKTLNWFRDIRRDPKNEFVLQTKCDKCGKWFSPTQSKLHKLIKNLEKPGEYTGFCCSVECVKYCPSALATNALMAHDQIRSGKRVPYGYNGNCLVEEIRFFDNKNLVKKQRNKIVKRILPTKKKTKKIKKVFKDRIHFFAYKQTDKYKDSIVKHNNTISLQNYYTKLEKDPFEWRIARLLYFTRARAKEKGWEHSLTKEWIRDNMKGVCNKTGIPFSYERKNRNMYAPSIDRIDNNRGYTPDNCQMVIWAFNQAKCDFEETILLQTLEIFCKNFENPLTNLN